MEQLSISIKKNIDGTWQASAAIGELGIPHAQAVNASRQPTTLEAVVNLTAAFAVVMPSLHDQLRDFVVEPPKYADCPVCVDESVPDGEVRVAPPTPADEEVADG